MDYYFIDNQSGLSVARVYGLDSIVEIPEADFGREITEVSPYCFSETQRGIETPADLYGDEPVAGNLVEEVYLPRGIRKIGAYAFYNCFQLRKLSLYSTTRDLGAGFLTGCTQLEEIDIYIVDNFRSCLRELLIELPQTLRVNYFSEDGKLLAQLIFPVYFENSIENTPGRILMRDMHGCGMMYRNCFLDTQFQFRGYDHLFREVDIYEGPYLACELAIKRLMYPYKLMEDVRKAYETYLLAHLKEAAESFDGAQLRCLLGIEGMKDASRLDMLLEHVLKRQDQRLTALVMNARYGIL